MEENDGENHISLKNRLQSIANEIKTSWLRDCDRTEYMISLTKIIKEMLTKETLEEYFSNNEEVLNYFMGDCMQEVIQYILIQPIIFGDNGDEIGLELLTNINKLFLKFHKNKKYAPLFEKIRTIFNDRTTRSFFSSDDNKNNNPIKKYDIAKFNAVYNPDFCKKTLESFKKGDEVDIPIDNESSRSNLDKKSWVRGRIKDIENDEYIVEYGESNGEKNISINDYNITKAGKKTTDWEWRLNLKKYDVIDCFDRSRWYPSTIIKVIEDEINGFKNVKYKIGFRLYPKYFKNLEDENDTYDKHLDIWKQGSFGETTDNDSEDQQFFGDKEHFDETIPFYSKRIQKFNTFSKCQQKYLNKHYNNNNFYSNNFYNNNNSESNDPMSLMNEKLENDTEISTEELYNYEVNGKKNCIIGSNKDFKIYLAVFLKKLENEGMFSKFIEILNNKPNVEEIYHILYVLLNSFSYIHKDYFKENSILIKNALINFIDGLDDKEMKNLPKDLNDIILQFLKKISSYITSQNNEKELSDLIDEITLTLSMKTIKTSIFDKRLQGIKALNDYIEKNKKNKDSCKNIILLLKKNNIIQEIFGANYHSQIINKSTEIVKLLLVQNELNEEDIKLIWSCTKKGDLEAKVTILKLLSELADNLKEEYVEILLNNIKSDIDKKIDEKEVELVYKLSMQGKNNEKNIINCCDYLCKCILSLKNSKIKNNSILDKLLIIVNRDDKYLEKVLEICENCLKNNENAILTYSILYEIMEKIPLESSEPIKKLIKDNHLLNLFEDNFKLYINQAKEILKKNNIPNSDGKIIDKYIINGFTHLENIEKRMEIFPYLINLIYKDYDFLPFLKEVLITNAVSPNDQSIFYDFVKNYISNNDIINGIDISNNQKEKIKQELFEVIPEDNNSEITLEKLKLFVELFFDINKDKIKLNENDEDNEFGYEIIDIENFDELKGLDKLWNIIFKIKEEKILSVAINIIFHIYKNKYLDKLLDKCKNLIIDENTETKIIDKCIKLLKLIIIESEKNIFFKQKSHLLLLKNCLINLPIEINQRNLNDDDVKKYLLMGNTTLNELKIIVSKIFDLPPKNISFSLREEYINKLKEIKNLENKNIFEKRDLGENNNNTSLYEILLLKNNLIEELKPKEKIKFKSKKITKNPLIINDELNPKLKLILQNWFKDFTEGTGKMDTKSVIRFISSVTSNRDQDESRANDFIQENDKDKKGYLNEEEFLNFYCEKSNDNEDAVWKNIINMGYRPDLNKKGTPFDFNYEDNEKLPRYKLGNDLSFTNSLIQKFYKNPNESAILYEFLLYLTTNENIYKEVLNMFDDGEKNSDINNALINENKYIEQNYIFIIIESIFQDLEIYLYNKSIDSKNNIVLGDYHYKLLTNKYEPFDIEENIEKKINFVKNLIKTENFQKFINYINNLLIKIKNIKNDNNENDNILSILINCFLRGIRIINTINNFSSEEIKENSNCLNELRTKFIYNLGYCNLYPLFNDVDIKKELNNILYLNLSNNIINYLNSIKNNKKDKDKDKDNYLIKNLYSKCLDLLMDLFSSKKQLLKEYTSKNEKQLIIDFFKDIFSEKDLNIKTYFIQNINQSIQKAIINQNYEYISFLYQILNSLLDNLLNFENQLEKEDSNKKDDNIFTPDSIFFDLYNHLYKLVKEKNNKEKLENENNIILDSENENYFFEKIYNLLMKGLKEIIQENEKKMDSKLLLSLIKLFEISLKDDEKLKNDILFKEKEGHSLFELLFNICQSQIDTDSKKNDDNDNTNNLSSQNENEDKEKFEDKFICLENIKNEKKEDNSSKEELNELCNTFILNCFKETKNPKLISKLLYMISSLKKAFKKKKNGQNSDSDSEEKDEDETPSNYIHNYSTRQHGHVGLKNLGCICYLNSIMQQIYMVPTFRYAIMHADDGETPKSSSNYRYSLDDDNVLHQLQEMYTYLTFSEKMDYNPRSFCYSFKDFDGNPINVGTQQDSQEFYNNFCDKIENSLKKTKFKYIVNDVFTGRTCSSVLCQGCKNISNRFEDFYNLTLEVKNINNLNDSLQKLIVPEIIDDFQCSNCNQKVRISKITSLNKLPNVLVVHLKRFYLDYEICHTRKINSKFEFPKKLNLKVFCVEEIIKSLGTNQGDNEDIYNREEEYYQYELKGINVHTGSADGGHYFSFIDTERDGKNNIMNENTKKDSWLTFNDSHVSEFDTDKIPSECFGGSYEGYSYENCQNAYLLIYERKKKTPIKIIMDEKETKNIKEENIVKIDKDNRKEIIKQYDLSRIGNNIDEKIFYNKIFLDTEKNEYYKYIPYYNIPKYAPRKVYYEVMKENNKAPSTKDNNKKYKKIFKKYKDILLEKINNPDFNINNEKYDDDSKENIISIALNDFMKKLNKRQNWDNEEKEKINNEFKDLIDKLIKPLINKDTSINILKVINKSLSTEDNISKIFSYSNNNYYSHNSETIINLENAKKICDIIHDLIIIFNNNDEQKYIKELNKILNAIFELIRMSKTKNKYIGNNNENENEKKAIIFIYELLYKLLKTNEIFITYYFEKKIISMLLCKLDEEKEDIRNIIYDIVIYLIKQTKDYQRELFDLKEDEKEGENEFKDKDYLRNSLDKDIINLLFEEKKELLIMLLIIFEYNDESFMKEFHNHLYRLFRVYMGKNKDEDLLEILLVLIKINDKLTFKRLYWLFGYPNLVIKQIPRIKKEKKHYYHNSYNNDSDDDNENDNDDENRQKNNDDEESSNEIKQKWPLFGEKLINGDINKQIYNYITPYHRKNSICLLSLLFPSEYIDEEKENEEKEEENNYYYRNNNDNDDDDNSEQKKLKNKKIIISEENKKKILLNIINNCLGEKNNYALFKYIYLMPSRSLLYKNLYEEIISYLKEDINFNYEELKEKEEKFVKNIEKEINISIEKAKKKDKKRKQREEYSHHYYDDDDNDDDDEIEENSAPILEQFKCPDKQIKEFIGFVSDIIPGEIVREELVEIATSGSVAMYRLEYFTKYYNVNELREKLLKKKEKEKEKENKKIKKEESKQETEKEEKTVKEEKLDEEIKIEDIKKEAKIEENDKKNEENIKSVEESKEGEKTEENKNIEEKKEVKTEENDKKNVEINKNEEESKEGESTEQNKNIEEKKEDNKKEDEKKEDILNENNKESKEENKSNDEEEKKEIEESEKEKIEMTKDEENKNSEEKLDDDDKEKREKEENEENEKAKKEIEEETKEEEEKIETEIDEKIDRKDSTKKYDISKKNENSFIYSLFGPRVKTFVLEDKSLKDKNKVKTTLIRFIFVNTERNTRNFSAKICRQKSLLDIVSLNFFSPDYVSDRVEDENITNFHSIYRIRGELPFLKNENLAITINFQN